MGLKLDNTDKIKSVLVVLEGFIVLIFFHAIGGYYFAPILTKYFSNIPSKTLSIISSSAVSPVLSIIYVALRTKFLPAFKFTKETFKYILSGIMLAWIVSLINVLILGKESSLVEEILKVPSPYYYLNLFLIIFWGPIIEELLCRGYFFEILKQNWNTTISLLLSSLLFVIPHGIWGAFDVHLFFIFLYSIVFTLLYIQGGLPTSISVHTFVNFYFLYLNM